MKNVEMLQEENELILERYELSMERIHSMKEEDTVNELFRPFFKKMGEFFERIQSIVNEVKDGTLRSKSIEELKEINTALYEDILPGAYEESYANPDYAVKVFGDNYGKLLSFLYTEIRSLIPCAFEYRLFPITVTAELLIEIYNFLEEENEFTAKEIKRSIYYFVHDYCEDYFEFRMRETSDPTYTYAYDIIMEEDLNDLRYLYYFGDYISDNELKIASFLNALPEEEVKAMADTYTEGYIRGFETMGMDLSKKEIVGIRYFIGFERMMKYAFENFKRIGKKLVVYRVATDTINKKPGRKVGYYATSPNLQYEYDHRNDRGLYFDKVMKERMLQAMKEAYEKYKLDLAVYAGPAVLETFGEPDFDPISKDTAIKLSEKQQKLLTEYANDVSMLAMNYMKADETSFTIIAYPLPSIGDKFEEIFRETVKVNTLDNDTYKRIQQFIIDALDEGEYCHILGTNGNDTDLKVMLYDLKDKEKETRFENCTADVNIPVGEVFTSPKLTGTNGCLNVSKVFLNGLEYKGLNLTFKDGMIAEYTCTNFDNEEDNKNFIKENLLMNHDTLPLGEFAIGTNTTAYVMGRNFDIQRKLPILIAEKTGPHFAVGDTCYKMSEDHKVFNPDGKEIVARDNEVSIIRKTDRTKAYFNCHTDITIPYNEIGEISVYSSNGTKVDIIKDGRFVLPGTLELNEALQRLK